MKYFLVNIFYKRASVNDTLRKKVKKITDEKHQASVDEQKLRASS